MSAAFAEVMAHRVTSSIIRGRITIFPTVLVPAEEVELCINFILQTKVLTRHSLCVLCTGLEVSNVTCLKEETDTVVDEIFCNAKHKPKPKERTCNDFDCLPK